MIVSGYIVMTNSRNERITVMTSPVFKQSVCPIYLRVQTVAITTLYGGVSCIAGDLGIPV